MRAVTFILRCSIFNSKAFHLRSYLRVILQQQMNGFFSLTCSKFCLNKWSSKRYFKQWKTFIKMDIGQLVSCFLVAVLHYIFKNIVLFSEIFLTHNKIMWKICKKHFLEKKKKLSCSLRLNCKRKILILSILKIRLDELIFETKTIA